MAEATDEPVEYDYESTLVQSKFEPPKIPMLRGEHNIEDWERAVLLRLCLHNLRDYVDSTVLSPPDTATAAVKTAYRINRLTTFMIIRSSIDPLIGILKTYGYNDKDTGKDKDVNPKKL